MARDEDEDLYDEEFDFVDDDDEADDLDEEEEAADDSELTDEADEAEVDDEAAEEEVVDEYGRPGPVANYVVHVYENKKFKRTLERPFTPEDAEAFATEYNRTSKNYGRFAVTGKNDAKPKKSLD
jgi:hypothetical protein